ncbi:hypothetical protein SAMN05216206_0612 [Pseudomonas guineae]|uniref:Uncharacterized protein n=1 Tax=Pseudomonas guineae TaxID=425504 RepID=A0A1I3DP08_9PSED|nr:hypothetical protein SAMN05216206_0612 [Pseudomonas guineae]
MEFFLFVGIVVFLILLNVKQKNHVDHHLKNQRALPPSKQPLSIRRPIKT